MRETERRNQQRKVNRREEDRFGRWTRSGRLSPPAENPGDGETKIIFPDKSEQSLPGKSDPCVGPAARISVVVRPVLFFQLLFLSVSDSLPFSLSPLLARFSFSRLLAFHVATSHRIVGAN